MSLRSLLTLFLCSILLVSCGKDTEEKVADAILTGNQLLSSGKCDEAITVLEGVGRRPKNARYLVVLSSAYACKGGYSELTLFEKDIDKTGTPSVLGGFTRFSTADDVTDIDERKYQNLKEAIKVLLFRGEGDEGFNPSISERKSALGKDGAAEVHAMLMYEMMAQIGRFLHLYGNPNASGEKGKGASTNDCLIGYDGSIPLDDYNNLGDYITAGTTAGSCDSTGSGDLTLGSPGSFDISKMCEGVVMVNNFLNLLPEVLNNYSGDEFDELSAITTEIDDAKDELNNQKPGLGDILNVTSFQKCIDDNTNDTEPIQIYYGVLLEELFL